MFDFRIPTFIFTFINFLVLYWLLKKLLFKPVTGYMQNRSRMIREQLENAERKFKEAQALKAQYEKDLARSQQKAEAIINEAREKAKTEYVRIKADASREAQKIIENAKNEIKEERQRVTQELKAHVSSLALKAAAKVIEENMDTGRNRKLVENFLDKEVVA